MEKNRHTRRSTNDSQQVKKRKTQGKRILPILGILLLFIMVGVIGVFGFTYVKFVGALNTINEQEPSGVKAGEGTSGGSSDPSAVMDETETMKPFAVAVVGTDNRSGSGGTLNSDVLMVAVVDQQNHEVYLLSIPRDTKIQIPGYPGYHKANMAFALGESKRRLQDRNNEKITMTGPFLVKEMLTDYLDIPIKYYVNIDFKGFEDVVDAVGGITVDVKRSMIYDDPTDNTHIYLQKGVQTLNGKKALDYVRFRKDNRGPSFYASDFDRNKRQQEVIRAIADKLISFKGVTSIYAVLEAAANNTKTNLSVDLMKAMAWDFKSFSRGDIMTIENKAYWDSDQGYTVIPDKRLKEIQQKLQTVIDH